MNPAISPEKESFKTTYPLKESRKKSININGVEGSGRFGREGDKCEFECVLRDDIEIPEYSRIINMNCSCGVSKLKCWFAGNVEWPVALGRITVVGTDTAIVTYNSVQPLHPAFLVRFKPIMWLLLVIKFNYSSYKPLLCSMHVITIIE